LGKAKIVDFLKDKTENLYSLGTMNLYNNHYFSIPDNQLTLKSKKKKYLVSSTNSSRILGVNSSNQSLLSEKENNVILNIKKKTYFIHI